MLIELATNKIRFSKKLLGTEEAWLWVGSAYGPIDNDDERVRATRELMEKYYPYVPYGMWVGNREGDTMISLKNTNGSYMLDLDWWPVGVYRINLHTAAGIESPFGSKLHPEKRDQDCSWTSLESSHWESELKPFLHQEENGAGYSLRFLIRPDRSIEPLGDQAK
jgi:hypothetical protein